MKFTCDVSDLKNGAQACDRALAIGSAESRNIKITAADGKISLCGYNGVIGVTTTIPSVGASEDGVIVLSSKMFAAIIKKLESKNLVTISEDVRAATIKCGEAVFKIGTVSPGAYPEMVAGKITATADIPQGALKDLLEETLYAADEKQMARPIFSGEQISLSSGALKVTGLDGYRIAAASHKIKYDGEPLSFVVPKYALNFISSIIDYSEDPIHVAIDFRHAIFNVGGYEIYTPLLAGDYPDISKIGEGSNISCILDAPSFAQSVQRVSVVSKLTNTPIVCTFSPYKTVSVSCKTGIGFASDILKLDEYSGSEFRIGFNPMYLYEALRHSPDTKVSVSMKNPVSPMVIAPEEGDSFRFIVLPVRLREESE